MSSVPTISERLTVRFRRGELALLEVAAAARSITPSEFVRAAVLPRCAAELSTSVGRRGCHAATNPEGDEE